MMLAALVLVALVALGTSIGIFIAIIFTASLSCVKEHFVEVLQCLHCVAVDPLFVPGQYIVQFSCYIYSPIRMCHSGIFEILLLKNTSQ